MSLKFILGDVGSGKTSRCIDEIINKDNSTNSLIYIVPEQFSMESERLLLKKKPEGVIINTGVYSFRHLAFNVMNELGVGDKNILNDIGRSMLLKKSLIDIQNDLVLYKTSINNKGFTDSLGSTIAELMQYNVDCEMLLSAIDNLDDSNLKYKLLDIEKIYDTYSRDLKKNYISAENTLDILSQIIENSKIIKESEIWIDGFKSFTPQEYGVIGELLRCSKSVTIALSVDKNVFETSLTDPYYETKTTYSKLLELAKSYNIEIEKPVLLNEPKRFNNNELKFLAESYNSYNKLKYEDKTEHINIICAKNKYDEIDFVCSKINDLCKNKGYKYEDIAVIIGDKEYEKPLSNALNHYDIPNFIDTRKDITSHPLTQTILSSLKLISDNMKGESVFRLLKSGYIDIDKNDVFLLENYVISQNIKGTKWHKEWLYGFDDKVFIKALIEDIRDIFLDFISPLTNNIKRTKKYTVKFISKTIFEFLKNIDATSTLNKNIKTATDKNDLSTAMIDKQIWGLLCDVFEKMVEFLGEEKVTISQYIKILESGLENSTIGVIPALSDQLIVGDIERTRLPDIKALFIMGLNEGLIPPQREEAGIFTDLERVTIKYNYFDLAPELSVKLSQDKLNIYMALTKPSDYLYLSYSTGSIKGEEKIKSSVINRIEEIFEGISEIDYTPYDNLISSPLPSLDKLVSRLKDDETLDDTTKALYNYYYNSEKYHEKIKSINSMLELSVNDYLSFEACKNLYGNGINISVSRLETFSKCPYSFFLTYCLGAYEKDKYKFEYLESGNIYHSALEQVFGLIKERNLELSELNLEEIETLSNDAIDAAIVSQRKESLIATPRYKGYTMRMKRTLKNALWGFSLNSKKDSFRPKEFELSFGSKKGVAPIVYNLDKGINLNLTGKIDRIDHLKDKDKIYVKIIDYKQSEHKIDFNMIYNGLDIQLPLYMNTYVNMMRNYHKENMEEGSILYYNVHNPQLSEESNATEKKILDSLRYRGIISDNKIIKDNVASSVISPIKLNSEEFKNLGDFINKKIMETGNEMAKGNIKIKPFRYINGATISTGCDMCNFKSICKIDLKDNKNKYNSFKADKNIKDKILKNNN
ncbi:MAG: PD-(D/E)XK nuclease family protein [Lachnospirales bacterium]